MTKLTDVNRALSLITDTFYRQTRQQTELTKIADSLDKEIKLNQKNKLLFDLDKNAQVVQHNSTLQKNWNVELEKAKTQGKIQGYNEVNAERDKLLKDKIAFNQMCKDKLVGTEEEIIANQRLVDELKKEQEILAIECEKAYHTLQQHKEQLASSSQAIELLQKLMLPIKEADMIAFMRIQSKLTQEDKELYFKIKT